MTSARVVYAGTVSSRLACLGADGSIIRPYGRRRPQYDLPPTACDRAATRQVVKG
jgi:hypothetical protein